jgi:hypothetical protein
MEDRFGRAGWMRASEESLAHPSPSDKPTPQELPFSDGELPPGNHPIEVAARNGFGPLSARAREVWHGDGMPCVSCGALVPRTQESCPHCEQDLRADMLAKMRAYAGPWYVYEHVRPFPGVTFERLVRQIQRGLLTETSIVRGPSTNHQWRFAVETPGLSRYFGRCWRCHVGVMLADTHCTACRAPLLAEGFEGSSGPVLSAMSSAPRTRPESRAPLSEPASGHLADGEAGNAEWAALRAALQAVPHDHKPSEGPPRFAGFRAAWIVGVLALALMVGLLSVATIRGRQTAPGEPAAIFRDGASTGKVQPSTVQP